jgi:hypothetical protein
VDERSGRTLFHGNRSDACYIRETSVSIYLRCFDDDSMYNQYSMFGLLSWGLSPESYCLITNCQSTLRQYGLVCGERIGIRDICIGDGLTSEKGHEDIVAHPYAEADGWAAA